MDTRSSSRSEIDKSDDSRSVSDPLTADMHDEVKDKPKKRGRKRREDKIKPIEYDDSNEDDSGSEEPYNKRQREFGMIGSPGPISPGHSATREPRSCVLSQRQKRKPLSRLLEQLLKNLEKKDHNQFFAWPVEDNYAPNYSTIIKKPMDFSTMKQKIDDNLYKTLNCFIADFKLMCNNAMKYNKVGTVYHKAARKLLHFGIRQLVPPKLRPLGNILTYMYEIPIRELGFDMGKMDVKALKQENSSTENQAEDDDPKESTLSAGDRIKLKMEAVREQHRRRLAKKAFPRMDANGFTSLQILVDNDGMAPSSNQRPVSLGLYTGRIGHGSGTLPGFREDRKNYVKGVKPLNYGAFGSYAPSYDSTFATISKEDSHLLYHTFGEETGTSTSENVLRFAPDSPWGCIYNMDELFPSRNATKTSPEISSDDNSEVKIDIENIRSLTEIGVDVDFLADIEDDVIISQYDFGLDHALQQNLLALKKLESEQRERLSLPIPSHLSNIAKPSLAEQETARIVVSNLKDMVARVQPQHVAPLSSIRKAMGVTLAHLDTPMSLDELHEISPEHALLADQLLKESHSNANGDASSIPSTDDTIKAEEESIDKKVDDEMEGRTLTVEQ